MRHDLIEGYFNLRQRSEGLKSHSSRFEFLPWHPVGKSAVRYSPDGWKLCVYRIEDGLEASVSQPDGTFSTYS